jgi:MinD-like ATPase involved in chromosome partitioning or flagellar assembly
VRCVLVVASGAAWESGVLAQLEERPEVVLLKRCVDVDDLLAAATAGQADAAVLSLDAPGLDAPAVEHLRRHRVAPVVVVGRDHGTGEAALARARRIGVSDVLTEARLDTLVDVLVALVDLDAEGDTGAAAPGDGLRVRGEVPPAPAAAGEDLVEEPEPATGRPGPVIAVWGPQGAPGRTTVATALAATLAGRGSPTLLVDADPWGGSVGQQLGVLDEVSGLLAAARLSTSGQLVERFAEVPRTVLPRLGVVTGLPRPDRWVEVRAGVVDHLVELAARHGSVVLDTGASLEEDPADLGAARPGRNRMTLEAVDAADEVVVVGAADPVGLSRLARGLVDLRERTGGRPVHVVVNRMRSSLGWSEKEVAGMVEGFTRLRGLHFLPDDRGAVDAALLAGRSVVEHGESPLTRAVAALAAAVVPAPETDGAPGRRRGRRAAGRGRGRALAPLRPRRAGTTRRR